MKNIVISKWLAALFFVLTSISFAHSDTKPNTFLIDPDFLVAVKAKIENGDQALIEAKQTLLTSADKILLNGTYTVTAKSVMPPSGDKRDFMSVGPYWWPDSSKKDGLPYIRKDGQVNPERHAIEDARYFGKLIQEVYQLSLAHYFSGDNKYAKHATKLLTTWYLDSKTRMNPNLNFGQSIPGRTKGRGIGLIDTREVAKLIDAVQILKSTQGIEIDTYKGIKVWYSDFLEWMLKSPIGLDEADEHNNHGTWYDVQVVSIALFTDQPALAKSIVEQQTKARIASQIKPSGEQPHELARTLSWNYSQMNLMGFLELTLLAENIGIDLWHYTAPNGGSIQNAFQYLLPYALGKTAWTYKQLKPIHFEYFMDMATTVSKQYSINDFQLLNLKKPINSNILLTNFLY